MVEVFKGKYRIVREIARSNDIVYEAIDVMFGRRIALKELNLAAGLDGQAKRERIERFSREARAAGRLTHPNIVAIYDFGEEEGRHFIAMEYLEGQNLRERISAQGVPALREAVDIVSQILEGLEFAHRNHVIHRDIKPDNIQILPGGQVKITDFGIARLTEEASLTSTGQVFGTPSYMSPEQIEGRGIDHRSDLFSVGIVLYELVTGRKPFVGDSVISITYAIMNQETPPMPGVPYGIEQTVRRALAKNPQQRYASAEEMRRDLRNAELSSASPSYMGNGFPTAPPFANAPYPLSGTPSGALPPMPSLPSSGTYGSASATATGQVIFTPLPPPASPANAPLAQQPWAWNGALGGAPPANQNPAPPMTQVLVNGVPQAMPHYVVRKTTPSISFSDAQRRFFLAVAVALLVGVSLGFGALAFMRSFEKFQSSAGAQAVIELIQRGRASYEQGDFEQAAKYFEAAQSSNRSNNETASIRYNLAATYIQMGNQRGDRGAWKEAQNYYEKATQIAPESLLGLAQKGLANALERQGYRDKAQETRSGIENPNAESRPPDTLPEASPAAPPPTREQVYSSFREQAQQLIREGDLLFQQGDVSGARSKWREATGKAPGDTAERAEAKKRLDDTAETPRF